jgi:hypothetical protein
MKLAFLLPYGLITVMILLMIGLGFIVGKRIRHRNKNPKDVSLGSIISVILALLGFILALLLSLVSSRYAERKQLVLQEANAISTAILRTNFLEEPIRSQSRQLFIQYVDLKVEAIKLKADNVPELVAEAENLQNQLWIVANQASNETKNSETFALYIESLNQVIDLHSERFYYALRYRLHPTLWFFLYFMITLAMLSVGYEFGINNSGSVFGAFLLALVFSSVIFIIFDFDQPSFKALIPVSQQPMLDLQKKLNN